MEMCGINNPAETGTRAINFDELKRSEWLTGPAWLKQRENEWSEQMNLTFASDEETTKWSSQQGLKRGSR